MIVSNDIFFESISFQASLLSEPNKNIWQKIQSPVGLEPIKSELFLFSF